MTSRLSRALIAATAAAALAVVLAGCGSSAAPTPTMTVGTGTPTTAPTGAQPDDSASPAPSATAAGADCDTLVVTEVHEELLAQGWTFKETPFAAGGVNLDGGLQCSWADYTVASGNLLLFGWAPITADQAKAMQDGLGTEGWLREVDGDTVYITEDPMQAPTTDENGYGMTYEFGDGWVTVADTKQNLLLIQRPGA